MTTDSGYHDNSAVRTLIVNRKKELEKAEVERAAAAALQRQAEAQRAQDLMNQQQRPLNPDETMQT